jgi:hypothetical protein
VTQPAPAQRTSTSLDRFLAALPYLLAALGVLGLLLWQAAIRKTPTIFTDELEWSQLSRSIAATGHAARRGQDFSFKSLYAFLIAPCWWIPSTASAYAAIKYLNTVVMALAAVPTFLLARMFVSTRIAFAAAAAAICTSALFYAPYIVPEVLAYPTFALCAWLSVRALADGGRRRYAAAIAVDVLAPLVRGELIVVPATFALAAIVFWLVGPSAQRLRRGWGRYDYLGATLLVVGALIVLNELVSPHAHQWQTVTTQWRDRFWSLGLNAASALALGLGLLPAVGGLASLWIPERRDDRRWHAFVAFTASAIVTVWTYTAVKAAYLSTIFATRVEERNLIYLGPLLIVGTAIWLCARRRSLVSSLLAWAFVTWLVVHYGYQLDFPYFEAPGYGIAAMANRAFHWPQSTIRLALIAASLVLLAVILAAQFTRFTRSALVLAAAVAVTWMLAGEITSSRGAAITAQHYYENLAQPADWIDRATPGGKVTFLGQDLAGGPSLGVDLTEFWNRHIVHVWSLDGTAPGPGPTLTPDLRTPTGILSHDPGLPYVVSTDRVVLVGETVAQRPNLTVRRVTHPWALHEAAYAVSDDGWITGDGEGSVADGTWAYFGPETTPGTLDVDVNRSGFCANGAPSAHVRVRVGRLALNEQRAPYIPHAAHVQRFVLANCTARHFRFTVTPPVAVEVTASPTVRPTDYNIGDSRDLGVNVGFSFTKR